MAMAVNCRISRTGQDVIITLLPESRERAYLLLDGLLNGFLRSFLLEGGGQALRCSADAADALTDDELRLSSGSIACIKRTLFEGMLRPADAAWLHEDIETAAGNVCIRCTN